MTRYARRDDGAGIASREASGDWAVREEDDGRTIDGLAVPYGTPTRRGGARELGPDWSEAFDPGAFAEAIAASRATPIPIIDEHFGDTVGTAELYDSPEGLRFRGRVLDVAAARDFTERVRARVIRPSIEFNWSPDQFRLRRAGTVAYHQRIPALRAIAAAYAPAYGSTSWSVRADGGSTPMEHCQNCGAELAPGVAHACATVIPIAPAQAAAAAGVATREAAAVPGAVGLSMDAVHSMIDDAVRMTLERNPRERVLDDPLAGYQSIGHLFAAAARGDASDELRGYAARGIATRALADTVMTSGANAGVSTAGVLPQIHGIVSRGRPAITAFGGPRPLIDGAGMTVDWPYFDGTLSSLVGVQSAEKAEITSVAVDIKKGSEAIRTFAGGSDISYQLLMRSTVDYLDVYGRIMLTAWAIVTDVNFVTELESGSATTDFAEALSAVDATELKNLLIDASVAVQTATGLPAEFVLAGPAAWTAMAKLYTPITTLPTLLPSGSTGSLDLRSLSVNIGGLPIIYVPSMTTGKFIASNREAAAWYEAGPFQATAEDVAKLGKNVAYWSLGAPARFIPAGIVEIYDVTP